MAIFGLATSAFALARASLGTVSNVTGVVSATQGATAVNVAPGTAITSGTRFISASGSSATLSLNNGCTVTVPPNHGVTVTRGMTCPQLQAAVVPIVPVGPVAVATSQGFVPALAVLGGIGLAAAALGQGSSGNDPPLSAR
ncbi:hypothetical protein HK414_18025 [Ramlibacter terrae]|uniref:IPTL-CTERM sorting domain-containing protein n=1 Tax=Ramlibacter terrae TaxID=2732511 RepID=A0ABX6P440_9BURK|nr:hypothetical protein HK414_18025 [Ramlibacter terrae]